MTQKPIEVTLEPCPFCGGQSQLGGSIFVGYHTICCEACRVVQPGRPRKEAIAAWNTRTATRDMQAEIERLRGARDDHFRNSERLIRELATKETENAQLRAKLDEAVGLLDRWKTWSRSFSFKGRSPFVETTEFLASTTTSKEG